MSNFQKTIDDMIAEQGDTWLACEDFEDRTNVFNAVTITDSPSRCWRVLRKDNEWTRIEDNLTVDELREFFVSFGSHYPLVINSLVQTSSGHSRIRAFIKNGRIKSNWTISIEATK